MLTLTGPDLDDFDAASVVVVSSTLRVTSIEEPLSVSTLFTHSVVG